MDAMRFTDVRRDHSSVLETCPYTPHTQLMLTHFVTTCKHNRVFHHSHMTKLGNNQAQRHLLSHHSLSWVTSAGIKELLCVSWAFRLWRTFLLPLEPKSMWGPTRFPVSAVACLCFQRPEGLISCQKLGKGSIMRRVGHGVV